MRPSWEAVAQSLHHRMEMQHQHIDADLLVCANAIRHHISSTNEAGVDRDHGALVVTGDIAIGDESIGL